MTRKERLREKQNISSIYHKQTGERIFKKYSESIKIFSAILIAIYPITNYIYEYIFQVKCENFYGIPGKYFSANINSRLLYLCFILLSLLTFLSPSVLRNYGKKQGKVTTLSFLYYILLSLLLGFLMGLINLQNLIEIMRVTNEQNIFFSYCNNWINRHAYFVIFTIIIICSFSIFGFIIIAEIKNKLVKETIAWIGIITYVISFSIILYGTVFKLSTSIEDKIRYEIITNKENKYVVLSEENDKILVVEYFIEDGKYIFDANQYFFLYKYDCKFSYVDIKTKPIMKDNVYLYY